MDRKKIWGAGIAVLVLAGAGLFTAFATSSSAANVTVSQQKGIEITKQSGASLGKGMHAWENCMHGKNEKNYENCMGNCTEETALSEG